MSIVNEIWNDVTGYEGYYQVSNMGRARSCDRTTHDGRWGNRFRKGKIIPPSVGKRGYVYIHCCKDGKTAVISLHKLVAKFFIGECPEGFEINHKDGDRLNNAASNLEYVTPSQNMCHAYANGLAKPMRGELNGTTANLVDSELLEDSDRGIKGFGSSGVS